MRESPVNRLETHWPQTPVPDVSVEGQAYQWKDMARSLEANVEDFMTEHPKLTLATAAAVGLVLGWMVKRK